jgi:hypothetical protein
MDDTIIYALGTLAVGLLGLIIKYSFKSKCSDISICYGLLTVHRNTECEEKDIEVNTKE